MMVHSLNVRRSGLPNDNDFGAPAVGRPGDLQKLFDSFLSLPRGWVSIPKGLLSRPSLISTSEHISRPASFAELTTLRRHLLESPRFGEVDTQPQRRGDFLRRPGEPAMRPYHPAQDSADPDDTYGHDRIVEGLRSDGVGSGQAEDNGDGGNPRASRQCDWAREYTEIERSLHGGEVLVPDDANQNRKPVRDIQANSRDRSRCSERY